MIVVGTTVLLLPQKTHRIQPQSTKFLQLEMAATVDWGEPFVKACYTLEGDGPLALECHEVIEKVSASIHTAYTPNVHAIAHQILITNNW